MNIVQIGTNKGNDDLTPLVNKYSFALNKFIAVEPLSVHHLDIKDCYKNIPQLIIEGIAIAPTPSEEQLTFYYHRENGPGYEVSSTSKEHILKHYFCNPKLTEDGLVELKVDCLTLNQLFEKHNLTDVELLWLDAEGLDFELIKSINFSKFNVNWIVFEHIHLDSNGKEAIEFLDSKGYDTQTNMGLHGWSHAASKRKYKSDISHKINDSALRFSNVSSLESISSWENFLRKQNPQKILEIGSQEGLYTSYLTEILANGSDLEIHCVDTWTGTIEELSKGIDIPLAEMNFDYNIKLSSKNKKNLKIYKHKGNSSEVMLKFLASGRENYFDFVFIADSNEAPDVLSNAITGFRLLKIGGMIGFNKYSMCYLHDINKVHIENPKQAIDAFTNIFYRKIEIVPKANNQIFIKKIAN